MLRGASAVLRAASAVALAFAFAAGCGSESACGAEGCVEQPSACSDGQLGPSESDIDCGGACARCGDGAACRYSADCESGRCEAGRCAPGDGEAGAGGGSGAGGEASGGSAGQGSAGQGSAGSGGTGAGGAGGDAGAGGSGDPAACSAACPIGASCSFADACASGYCTDGVCTETGGPDPTVCVSECPVGSACTSAEVCASGVCSDGSCQSAPSCSDSTQNGGETDVDCGGAACAPCARGKLCAADRDCSTTHCSSEHCVAGPSAGFGLNRATGPAPLSVTLSNTSSAGDAAISSVQYRFGDGDGFGSASTHTYTTPGTYTITQRVTDANGFTATTTRVVQVTSGSFTPVLLSDTDRSELPLLELTGDRLGVEIVQGSFAGVRSDRAIFPGSGFFYYEGERTTDVLFLQHFGVATANVPLDANPECGQPGPSCATNESVLVSTGGGVYRGTSRVTTFSPDETTHYGFAVDYRGANPIVHVIVEQSGDAELVATVPMTGVTDPLFVFVGGMRRQVGVQARINPGNDTTNVPFRFPAAAVLEGAGFDGDALVLGFGQSNANAPNSAPSLDVDAPTAIAFGDSITLSASATDAEDGTLSASIRWADRATTYLTTAGTYRENSVGASWEYRPSALGIHPIEVSVTDSGGLTTTEVVDLVVTGSLPQLPVADVRLALDDFSGAPTLRADGLAANWIDFGKYGVRANQGMIGEFWYFETRRLGAPGNQGSGVVIAEGRLDPYQSLDVPPSCSLNADQSIWQNLISVANYDRDVTSYYGFAVDYRGRHPIVYVITEEAGTPPTPVVAHVMELTDVTVPVYPMLYGNPLDATPFDGEINFGATPFHYGNPAAVIAGAGYDASGLQLGWGDTN